MDNVKCCATSNIPLVCHDTSSIYVDEVMAGSSPRTELEKLAVAQKSGKTHSRMPAESFSLFGVVLNEESTGQGSLDQQFGSVSSYRYIPTKKFLSYDQYRCMVKNGKVFGVVGYAMCKIPDDARLLFEKTVSLLSQKFGEGAVSLNERCGVFIIGNKHSLESVCVTIFKLETIYGGQAVGIMAGRIKDIQESRLEMSKIQDQELEAL